MKVEIIVRADNGDVLMICTLNPMMNYSHRYPVESAPIISPGRRFMGFDFLSITDTDVPAPAPAPDDDEPDEPTPLEPPEPVTVPAGADVIVWRSYADGNYLDSVCGRFLIQPVPGNRGWLATEFDPPGALPVQKHQARSIEAAKAWCEEQK